MRVIVEVRELVVRRRWTGVDGEKDLVVARTDRDHVIDAAVVEHIRRCHRTAATAKHRHQLPTRVVEVCLGECECPGIETAVSEEIVISNYQRIQIHP